MTFIRYLFLLVLILMMEHHGITCQFRTQRDAPDTRSGTAGHQYLAKNKSLQGTWRLSGVTESDEENEDGSILVDPRPDKQAEFILSFFPDSTYTQVANDGTYRAGKWAFDETSSAVFLTTGRKTEEVRVIFDVAANGSRLAILEFSPVLSLSLTEFGKSLRNFREDPYYPANNLWRIKPDHMESEKEIKDRLTSYVAHNALILKAAQIREQESISWEFSEGIIRLYNVGIGIVKKEQIPVEWSQSFHSMEDARRAYKMFESYLLNGKHVKSATGNWVRDDYNILVGIRSGLEKR